MVTVALLVRLEDKPGKEAEVASLLRVGLSVVHEEPETTVRLAIYLGPSTFDSFDALPDEAGLTGKASELFAQPPIIEAVDVSAAKHLG